MRKEVAEIKSDEDALQQVCGGLEAAERVKTLWEDMMQKKRLDCSGLNLTDDDVSKLLKGLHM